MRIVSVQLRLFIYLVILFFFSPYLHGQIVDTVFANHKLEQIKQALEEREFAQATDSLEYLYDYLEKSYLINKKIEILSLLVDVHGQNGQYSDLAYTLERKVELLKQKNDMEELAKAYEYLCFALYRSEKFDQAIISGEEALRISEITRDSITRLYALSEISYCHFSLGNFEDCTGYSYRVLELAELLRDTTYIASSYTMLGRVYKNQGEYESSESFLNKAINIFRIQGDTMRMLNPLNDLGILYKTTANYPKAIEAFETALAMATKKDIKSVQITLYVNLTSLSIEQGDFEQANIYMYKLEELRSYPLLKEATLEIEKLKAQLLLHDQEYDKALTHIKKSYDIAIENDRLPKLPDILQVWGEINTQKGDYKEAIETYKLYAQYKDSLVSTEKNKIIEGLKAKFETAEKEKRLQEQENEIELANLRFRISVFAGVLVIIFSLGFIYVWRRRNELERKAIEKEQMFLKEKNKSLEEVDQLKSRFFNNISHELRTPISLISTPVAHLINSSSSLPKKEVKVTLNIVYQNAQKLLALVEELLELSKVEAGKAELTQAPLDIKKFCKEIFSLYHSKAADSKINYQFTSNFDDDILLLIDRKKLEKIINNLLSNALKYTTEGGKVNLQLQLIPLKLSALGSKHPQKDLAESQKVLIISIKDTGRGIPEEDLPFVFDRYFQSKSKEMPVEGGTGIGLAFAKELVQLMGGIVEVESKWGYGSTFTVSIPVEEYSSNEQEYQLATVDTHLDPNPPVKLSALPHIFSEELPTQTASKEKAKILIVEDNQDIQWMIRNLLKDNYDCVVANHGTEALKLLESNRPTELPSLILSDIMMPQMDGYAFLKELKLHDELSKIPVIMLTARAEEDDKLQALRMGVDDYLVKPFSAPELKARISNLLDNYAKRKSFVKAEKNKIDITFEKVEEADQKWLKSLESAAKKALDDRLPISASYLAAEMALSERQLRRRLQALTGLNSKQYIQEIKLQKARHLLENKSFNTVSEVAYACGFNTPTYFTKLYTKHFGRKPASYLVRN